MNRKYLVGLHSDIELKIKNVQIIEAAAIQSAESQYNEIHNCKFHGVCIGEVISGIPHVKREYLFLLSTGELLKIKEMCNGNYARFE